MIEAKQYNYIKSTFKIITHALHLVNANTGKKKEASTFIAQSIIILIIIVIILQKK